MAAVDILSDARRKKDERSKEICSSCTQCRVLQRVGRSFMLPIAILPVAGLLLGIGSSFTNETTIATYGLQKILGSGTLLNSLLIIMNKVGSAVFDNQTLNELNRFYLVMYKWKSYLKWSKGDVGQFIFSSLCSCICHTDSPFQ